MESEIWRVRSQRIGSIEPFKSEYDMESFLINNPAIIGCWNPDSGTQYPTLIRQQLYTKRNAKNGGRIDLVGINIKDTNIQYELRIFELKLNTIDIDAVNQLHDYLTNWNEEKNARLNIKRWILEDLQLKGVDKSNVDQIIDKPLGVLVGPGFDTEAIIHAKKNKFKGIRLARFKASVGEDYYIILEDVIGDVVQRAKRTRYDWQNFIDKSLIARNDEFIINNQKKAVDLTAYPDPDSFSTGSMKLIFDDESVTKLLSRKENIKINAAKQKWTDDNIQLIFHTLKDKKGFLITDATAIVFFAYGWPPSFWVPGQVWRHKKTHKKIEQLKIELNI